MKTVTAAAIYARISSDIEGSGKGVERQIEDCHRRAAELGWTVAGVYVDNDISAYSGKHRPDYNRMLDDIRAGTLDAVLVYNLDRLTRKPGEFEGFHEVASARGVDVRFVTGDTDLGTDDGLFLGRIQAAMAAQESAKISRRVRRKLDEVAAEGRPHGGSIRPFGFAADKITHVPEEVAFVRQVAARFIAGEGILSLTRWANTQHVRPTGGDQWRSAVLRDLLTKPRTAGLRVHRGEIIGPAVWEPVISVEDRNRILAIVEGRRHAGRRAPRRYLLSGLLRCGRCGNRLYAQARATTRRYVCSSGPDHGGCGGTTIVAQPVEELIAEAVLHRLGTPELAQALSGTQRRHDDTESTMQALSADREQLAELATHYGQKAISMAEWVTARKIIEDRINANERTLRRATNTGALASVIGQGDALPAQSATLDLGRQVAIIETVFDHAVIGPGQPSATSVDPERISPVWRL